MTAGIGRIGPTAGAAILVLALAAGSAPAQNTNGTPSPFSGGGRGRGPGGPGGPGIAGPLPGMLSPRLVEDLGLTDTQQDTLASIGRSHGDEWKALMDRERQGREAVRSAIAAEPLDEAAIRQRIGELSAVEADMAVAQARARVELLQVLTADQKARLKTLQSQKPGLRGRRG